MVREDDKQGILIISYNFFPHFFIFVKVKLEEYIAMAIWKIEY